ncbi:MAG: glycosyltransferase family 2 protein [Proteobacteria bacterium]|nr:glycosyltransferase family 2 protein [Pseudomonadota bacterium]
MTHLISVIVPTYNEAENIEKTIKSVLGNPNIEIIVVDGGSNDNTLSIVRNFQSVKIINSNPGRACQQNFAAKQARGEILLFLHADSILPPNFTNSIIKTLATKGVVAGSFRFKSDHNSFGMRCLEGLINLRVGWFGMPYGDQGIFLKRKLFSTLGGFPEIPIMEDYELLKSLRSLGTIAQAQEAVTTSARRWQKLGILRTTWINQKIILAYHMGVPLETLKRWYS